MSDDPVCPQKATNLTIRADHRRGFYAESVDSTRLRLDDAADDPFPPLRRVAESYHFLTTLIHTHLWSPSDDYRLSPDDYLTITLSEQGCIGSIGPDPPSPLSLTYPLMQECFMRE